MNFTKLIPNIFYEDINDGIELFVNCLGFQFGYKDLESPEPCCVVDSGNLAVFLFQNTEFARKDRPEIRLHTSDIDAIYLQIKESHPHFLHPNLNIVTLRPWGAREFALKDNTNICVIIQQW